MSSVERHYIYDINELSEKMFPCNGQIPNGTDFNTLLTVGSYYIPTNDMASAMTNIPTGRAGRLFVLNMLGDDKVLNRPYQYFLQIYMDYYSGLWMRSAQSEDTTQVNFGNWVQRW